MCDSEEVSSTALLESGGNLFSRLALRHGHQSANAVALTQGAGFGPDAFIAPILNGAVDTIVVKISERYITYFMSCLSARYTGYLTGWKNDVDRPFVVIWTTEDALREAENVLAAVQVTVGIRYCSCLL